MTDLSSPRPGPQPFLLLLDEAMRYTRRHFRAIYPAVAIPIALLATAVGVAQALLLDRILDTAGTPQSPLISLESIAASLVYLGVLIVGYNAMQVAAADAVAGRPIDVGRGWRFTLQPRVLGTLALWYVAVMGSFVLCCLPFFFVAPLLSFIPMAMADEGAFGLRAFSRSSELARHNPGRRFSEAPWFKALLLMLVVMVISYVVTILVTLPFQLPMLVDIFRSAAAGEDPTESMGSWLWLQVPGQLLGALASTAVYLYMSFGVSLLFFDTRGRKEGTDLVSAIDEVFS